MGLGFFLKCNGVFLLSPSTTGSHLPLGRGLHRNKTEAPTLGSVRPRPSRFIRDQVHLYSDCGHDGHLLLPEHPHHPAGPHGGTLHDGEGFRVWGLGFMGPKPFRACRVGVGVYRGPVVVRLLKNSSSTS